MNPERKFIHDISNPVGVALGMVETSLDAMRAAGNANPEDVKRLEKALAALLKTVDVIHARREEILAAAKAAA